MIAQAVYLLCALTSITCTVLLWRRFLLTKAPLLLWSGLGFLAFAAANILLYVDLILVPQLDMSTLRNAITLSGVVVMLFGLIRTTD